MDTQTLSCRPHSWLFKCAWEPLSVKASSATATTRHHTHTHSNHFNIFSRYRAVSIIKALPRIFALLFSLVLLVRRTLRRKRQASARFFLPLTPIPAENARPYFSYPSLLSWRRKPFWVVCVWWRESLLFITSDGRTLLWCNRGARLAHSASICLGKKHTSPSGGRDRGGTLRICCWTSSSFVYSFYF